MKVKKKLIMAIIAIILLTNIGCRFTYYRNNSNIVRMPYKTTFVTARDSILNLNPLMALGLPFDFIMDTLLLPYDLLN